MDENRRVDMILCLHVIFPQGYGTHAQRSGIFLAIYLAKRSQHADATCRNIVGRNMLRAFDHRVAMCCNMLGVVVSNLKMVKFETTTPNMSQNGGQTHATCFAQQCCDLLRWHVAIVWRGLYSQDSLHPFYRWITALHALRPSVKRKRSS